MSRGVLPFNWTLDQTKKLIDILKNHRHLWDKRVSGFSNIGSVKGLEIMINLLDMPNMTQKQLKCKLRNMKNTYKLELRKIKVAEKRGFFYRPTLPWFKDFQGVMENVEEEVFDEATASSDTYVVSIKQECIDNIVKGDTAHIDFEEQPQLKNLKRIHVEESQKTLETPEEIDITYEYEPIEELPMDEFQMFADHVAEQLRLVSLDLAHKLQKEIESLFDTNSLINIYDA
ncbi:uncharacterized protein ACR2FA_011742 [Aphomia sociella]